MGGGSDRVSPRRAGSKKHTASKNHGGTPNRSAVIDLLAAHRRALHASEISSRLSLGPTSYGALQRVLDDLCLDGTVVALSGERFRLSTQKSRAGGAEVEGKFHAHARGFGFVQQVGMADDLYVPEEAIGGAMHGDIVKARIVSRSARGLEGAITGIAKRRNPRIPGIYRTRGKAAYVEPDDSRIRGPISLDRGQPGGERADDGDAVVALITQFPERGGEIPSGELQARLGKPGDPEVEVQKILIREEIEPEHSPEAIKEAEAFGDEVRDDEHPRTDLRHIPLPTIDPEDARDHDDALWAERTEAGDYHVWIAIADVSFFVRPGTALDTEARTRGNSVYLPDRAIPMLPSALSSKLCSLLPDVDRLCMYVELTLDPAGVVKERSFGRGLMRSAAKLTYPSVARTLGLTQAVPRDDAAEGLSEGLHLLWDLSQILRAKRMRRGALDLNVPEPQVIFDPNTGHPIDVRTRTYDPGISKAYRLVEEMMLLANETVADMLVEKAIPTVFRNHGKPDPQKIERFAAMCDALNIPFESDAIEEPKKLSVFLKKIDGHRSRGVLHNLLMRSLKQAAYDIANIGHFGLASPAYLHFTSPIRRYPDLLVHRAVKAVIDKTPTDRSETAQNTLKESASLASSCERRAMEVEREITDVYRTLVMQSRLGTIAEGSVSAIVSSGIFVTLDDPFVDVLVLSDALGPEPFVADDMNLSVTAPRSGETITLGDRMLIEITDAVITRRIVHGRRLYGTVEAPLDPVARRRERRAKKGAEDRPTRGKKGPQRATDRKQKPPSRKNKAPKGGKRRKR